MNKPELIEYMAEQHGLSKSYAREILDSVLDRVADAARQGEVVQLYGFGTFKVAERSARQGRNPQTGEPVKIPTPKTLRFSASPALKATFNKKRRAKKGA